MAAAEVSVVCKPWIAQDRMEQWVMTKSIEDMDQRPHEDNTLIAMVNKQITLLDVAIEIQI